MIFVTFYVIFNFGKFKFKKKGQIFIFQKINQFFIALIIFTILICVFFVPIIEPNIKIIDYIENGELLWPAPGYTRINSEFGKRTSPISGTPSFHYGVDIGAPQNSEFVAVTNGTITYVGFLGGGGYTITLTDENTENGEIKYSYCHCDPNFIVSIGDYVVTGQVIGHVINIKILMVTLQMVQQLVHIFILVLELMESM